MYCYLLHVKIQNKNISVMARLTVINKLYKKFIIILEIKCLKMGRGYKTEAFARCRIAIQ